MRKTKIEYMLIKTKARMVVSQLLRNFGKWYTAFIIFSYQDWWTQLFKKDHQGVLKPNGDSSL